MIRTYVIFKNMKKLKIGFLIDETTVDYYIWDLICHLNDNELFEAPVFYII